MATEYKLSYTASQINAKLGKIDSLAEKNEIPNALSDLAQSSTYRTVTDAEKAVWNNKSNFSGNYNDLIGKPTIPSVSNFATKDYVDNAVDDISMPTKVSDLINDVGYIKNYTETDPTVPAWAKSPTKPTYTANDVGALPNTTVIPDSLSDLADDSTHRTVTDSEKTTWNNKSDFSGSYNDLTNKPTIPSISGLATESYVNNAIAAIPIPDVSGQIGAHNTSTSAHNDIRDLITGLTTRLNTIADSDDITLDQMSEIVAYIKSNKSLIEGITTNKVNVSDIINNLETNVSNKVLSASQGVVLKGLIDNLQTVVNGKQDNITGTVGNFVVIGEDGKATTEEHNTSSDAHSNLFAEKMPLKTSGITLTANTTLGVEHTEKMLFISTANTTITIPTSESAAIPVGSIINIINISTGTITFATQSGVTLNTKDNALNIEDQYSAVTLYKASDTVWYGLGALA